MLVRRFALTEGENRAPHTGDCTSLRSLPTTRSVEHLRGRDETNIRRRAANDSRAVHRTGVR